MILPATIKYWQCNYCPNDSPADGHILGCDNKPLLHLIDPINCPNAPATARHEVRAHAAGEAAHERQARLDISIGFTA
jgi:hypothetical protein